MPDKLKLITTGLIALVLNTAIAQDKNTRISKMVKAGDIVEVTISSPEQFYVGSRPYTLQIGDKLFTLSKQVDYENESTLTFYVPAEDFDKLENHAKTILVYGLYTLNSEHEAEGQFPGPKWELGAFDKGMPDR